MGAMTLADYREAVPLVLNNVSGNHPVLSANYNFLDDAINRGANRMIRENPDLFPEHNNRSFTIGPLAAGSNRTALPSMLLIFERLTRNNEATITITGDTTNLSNVLTNCTDTSDFEVGDFVNVSAGFSNAYQQITAIAATTLTLDEDATSSNAGVTINSDPGDWSNAEEVPVVPSSLRVLGYMEKSSSGAFPQLYVRKATDISYGPPTRAGYSCYFRAYGVSGELPLVDAGDAFRFDAHFDQAAVYYAASELAEMMERTERAEALLAMAKQRLGDTVNVSAMERAHRPVQWRVAGIPR